MSEKGKASFTRFKAVNNNRFYVACSPEEHDVGHPFTRISELDKLSWTHKNVNFWVSDLEFGTSFGSAKSELLILGQNGEFVPFNRPELRYQIVDLEKLSEDENLGYLLSLNQAGSGLFACGDGGQTYRQTTEGIWERLDDSLFDRIKPDYSFIERAAKNPELLEDREFDRLWNENIEQQTSKGFQHIIGGSETDIFLCGGKGNVSSLLYKWNSEKFIPTQIPDNPFMDDTPSLNQILIESDGNMFVCGQRGSLLQGDFDRGFKHVEAAVHDITYYKMARYEGLLYLATNIGLHVYDGGSIQPVYIGVEQQFEDVHTVQAVDDVLWAVGSQDIMQLSQNGWQRIEYPH